MTSPAASAATNEARFNQLEDPASDFPFYNGTPVVISNRQWLIVLATVVIGFLVLALPIPWPKGTFWQFIPVILMPGIPLVALSRVAPGKWRAIFGKVGRREVKLMFGFALLNVVISMTIGSIVHALIHVTPNASMAQLGSLGMAERFAFFAKTIPQLLGEEVITLLPFLALLQWFSKDFRLGRKSAIIGAWLMTSIVFGLIHLPTYDWNWIQCLVVIGAARMMLTLPWIMTKNIWVSTGAHIVNDWLLFIMTLFGAGLMSKA
ncbi:type II CAAX endopeptidase family protein [Propionivibrio dicarboxylicus]|uniref:CAAX prenyl protease 2/Lysostaphin resistance protein A-like domain-containing protein n=1 Tax=Propionivibrio dicarboxylicus TaxID=83767 RepID=A0A1G8FWW5_9RHOO|nr:type II CAAX endopeptidase family protein [Propionivibrio dicarboxylicus]SDH86555.1 hypothetical protein SAMN05660652_02455 [Propionivibrio dicarboxylicus]